jgi:sulfoxide reductase heme-binding subunit YedZ
MSDRLRRWRDSRWLFWLVLAAPGAYWTYRYLVGATFYGEYLHATGELGARLLIVALAVTPLGLMFPSAAWPRWLARRRRYVGVAAFGYSLAHAAVYLARQADLSAVVDDAAELGMAAGWIAFLVMLVLAATSNDVSVRVLKRGWRYLHRAVYAAAVLTLAHWVLTAFDPLSGAIHLGVLAAIEATRLGLRYANRRRASVGPAAD